MNQRPESIGVTDVVRARLPDLQSRVSTRGQTSVTTVQVVRLRSVERVN